MAEGGISQVPSPPNRLVFTGPYLTMSPPLLFEHWVDPDLLALWWPPVARVDVRVGGTYQFTWPQMNWHLRGSYTTVEPGRHLAFTWSWDHEERPERAVSITFEPLEIGTRLTLVHGFYTMAAEEQEERRQHADGWQHFLNRLYVLAPLAE